MNGQVMRLTKVLAVGAVIGSILLVAAGPASAVQTCGGFAVTVDIAAGDVPSSNSHNVILGTPGDDVIVGGSAGNRICGLGGDDELTGGNGVDYIYGGDGADVISGGGGADHLFGNAGPDIMDGGAGHDLVRGDAGNNTLHGGLGNDLLVGGSGNDMMFGDPIFDESALGDDTLWGGVGDDQMYGGSGDDRMGGGEGRDYMIGGSGRDELSGGPNPIGAQDFLHTGNNYPNWSEEVTNTAGHAVGAPFPQDGQLYERLHLDCWWGF